MKIRYAVIILAVLLPALFSFAGCGEKSPSGISDAAVSSQDSGSTGLAQGGPPGYEPAYVNGTVVTINAIEVPNHAPEQAQADFYQVVYPTDWQSLGLAPPQCNPCDHDNNGIDPADFHDHVLDSQPGDVGYRAPWHVWLIMPAYNGDSIHDAAVDAAYAAQLPATSEAAVEALVASTLPGGAPVAVQVDTDFYFLCAVVGQGRSQ
jgi:predicted small lipoprotein YifL